MRRCIHSIESYWERSIFGEKMASMASGFVFLTCMVFLAYCDEPTGTVTESNAQYTTNLKDSKTLQINNVTNNANESKNQSNAQSVSEMYKEKADQLPVNVSEVPKGSVSNIPVTGNYEDIPMATDNNEPVESVAGFFKGTPSSLGNIDLVEPVSGKNIQNPMDFNSNKSVDYSEEIQGPTSSPDNSDLWESVTMPYNPIKPDKVTKGFVWDSGPETNDLSEFFTDTQNQFSQVPTSSPTMESVTDNKLVSANNFVAHNNHSPAGTVTESNVQYTTDLKDSNTLHNANVTTSANESKKESNTKNVTEMYKEETEKRPMIVSEVTNGPVSNKPVTGNHEDIPVATDNNKSEEYVTRSFKVTPSGLENIDLMEPTSGKNIQVPMDFDRNKPADSSEDIQGPTSPENSDLWESVTMTYNPIKPDKVTKGSVSDSGPEKNELSDFLTDTHDQFSWVPTSSPPMESVTDNNKLVSANNSVTHNNHLPAKYVTGNYKDIPMVTDNNEMVDSATGSFKGTPSGLENIGLVGSGSEKNIQVPMDFDSNKPVDPSEDNQGPTSPENSDLWESVTMPYNPIKPDKVTKESVMDSGPETNELSEFLTDTHDQFSQVPTSSPPMESVTDNNKLVTANNSVTHNYHLHAKGTTGNYKDIPVVTDNNEMVDSAIGSFKGTPSGLENIGLVESGSEKNIQVPMDSNRNKSVDFGKEIQGPTSPNNSDLWESVTMPYSPIKPDKVTQGSIRDSGPESNKPAESFSDTQNQFSQVPTSSLPMEYVTDSKKLVSGDDSVRPVGTHSNNLTATVLNREEITNDQKTHSNTSNTHQAHTESASELQTVTHSQTTQKKEAVHCKVLRRIKEEGLDGYMKINALNWLCLLRHVSKFNTSLLKKSSNSRNFGILQFNSKKWCKDGKGKGSKNLCRINCAKFLDEDITDDFKCAKIVVKTTKSLAEWSSWKKHCKGKNLSKYAAGC